MQDICCNKLLHIWDDNVYSMFLAFMYRGQSILDRDQHKKEKISESEGIIYCEIQHLDRVHVIFFDLFEKIIC